MIKILVLAGLLQLLTVLLVLQIVRRHIQRENTLPKGCSFKACNAMVEILVLKIRGYLTSVQWFAELLSKRSMGELNEQQTQLIAQLSESCEKARESLECIIKSMRGKATVSELQIFEPSEEELKAIRARHRSEEAGEQ